MSRRTSRSDRRLFRQAVDGMRPNFGKAGRSVLSRAFPEAGRTDETIARFLVRKFRPRGVMKLPGRIRRAPPAAPLLDNAAFVRVCRTLMQSWMFIDLAAEMQGMLAAKEGSRDYPDLLYMWRVYDDIGNTLLQRVHEELPSEYVATPYGIARQSPAYLPHRQEIEEKLSRGEPSPVWRINGSHGNRPQWSPFWTYGVPEFDPQDRLAMTAYLRRMGIPPTHFRGEIFTSLGVLRPDARFVVRAAPSLETSPGGGVEIVTTWDSVEIVDTAEWREVRMRMLEPFKRAMKAAR